RTVLPNGLRILTEDMPSSRSVSLGIWVAVGSRDETPVTAGVSHFLEHLIFKGTRTRSAMDISAQIEAVGGETNAFTSKECTCYYARVLDEDLLLATDVMCDIVTDSLLAEADIEIERGVILEEIAMHDDEPGDEVHDLFTEALYDDHPLGRKISGTADTVGALTPAQITAFYEEWYVPGRIVVAAAGNLNHDLVVDRVRAAFDRIERFAPEGDPAPRRPRHRGVPMRTGHTILQEKDTEQAHVVLGGPALARDDERRFALGALNNVLGAGMSSRLFQQIRERRGLAYSVYSYTSQYADTGLLAVYAGCAPTKVDEVLALARHELATVCEAGLTGAEVQRGKGMFRGALVLGLEDVGARMSRLGKGELAYDELLTVDQLLDRIDAVTPEAVRAIAAAVLSEPLSLAGIGPFADRDGRGAAVR
ncbi:MAG: insulinase family protein, partial [Dactylosporangium sp.]|nr:insulinase family protein [Dactylosporangium sp.]NNJ61797.1 insulinase family protein [Dactylosporangium sp.]